MKVNIETLQDTFKYGYEQHEPSRIEAAAVWDNYHNRQYSSDQLSVLANRGQPAETFNVIKLFSRMLMGYFSSVVNTVSALPVQMSDTDTALVMNDVVQSIFEPGKFQAEGDKVKLSAIIAGIMCVYEEVVDTGRRDQFGRPIREINHQYVPDDELVFDPSSTKDDYSDANWVHRFKWVHEDLVTKTFGKEATDKLYAYHNHLNQTDAEFEVGFIDRFVGKYKIYDNYLIVHSVMIDDDDRKWSVFWCDDIILQKTELKTDGVRFPYRIRKVHSSNKSEYYGIFREVLETQKAINQALIKFQLLSNSQKVFVQDQAVENIGQFTDAFNRVTGVIEVKSLAGIKIVDLSREALEQYVIIDKAFDRIQKVLSINDSFLGLAFASDSGRKVKLQQNASITALRYLTGQIEQFYTKLGEDTVILIKKYYTAHQLIRLADEDVGIRWAEVNKPLEIWTGDYDENGEPVMEVQYEEALDPDTGKPLLTDEGDIILAPIPEQGSEIAFTEVDITVTSVSYDDAEEKNQIMLDGIVNGNGGQLLAQVNPSGYFQVLSLSVKNMQTKQSAKISKILSDTAEALAGNPEAEEQASNMASGNPDASSQQAKPQNEGPAS